MPRASASAFWVPNLRMASSYFTQPLSAMLYRQVNTPAAYSSPMQMEATPPNPGTLGDRIKWARLRKELTQVQLAALASIKQPTLSSLETNETKQARSGTLLRIAAALDVEPYWLQTGTGSPTPPAVDPSDYHFTDILTALTPANRRSLLLIARAMLADQTEPVAPPSSKPSRNNPFPHAPKPSPKPKKATT
jgi:transcriptional regulator with XRE-family HTH domain